MAKTHKQFAQELKEQSSHQLEDGVREFQEYKRKRIKNKYDNWVLKRKEEGKDYSIELFQKLHKYFEREQQKFDEILDRRNKESLRRQNCGHIYMADDEIMYHVKQELYHWRENDREYQEMQEEIEELRYVSDKSIQSLSNDGR